MREIVSQNRDYFAYYPKRAGWLSQVSPCRKGAYWDIEYGKDSLMLFEMAFNRNAGKYVSSETILFFIAKIILGCFLFFRLIFSIVSLDIHPLTLCPPKGLILYPLG